jgi:hypothetical protein
MKESSISRFCFSLILLFFLSLSGFSQKDFDVREFFVEAESYFLFEEFAEALPLYQRILGNEPDNYNVMYKIGICYLNDPYQKSRSIKYLTEASGHVNPKFKSNSYKEKLAPSDVLYYLGQAHRVTGNIDEAIKFYSKFKNSVDPNIYNLEVVEAELESCKVAKGIVKAPVYSKSKNVGEIVNTRFAEVRPVMSGDGRTMVFTRLLQFYDAVFITSLDSVGGWSEPYNLTPDFGLDGNSYVTGISYNGDEIFVYRSDDYDGNIYSSRKIGIHWQPLRKLNENINTKYWESHASPSLDGQYLYFTSNRKGGYGGLDIYRSPKQSNGQWGVPVNLGPVVNSSYNEDTPFISPQDNRLYFSSLGHNGMGGYDVFVSEKIGPEQWAKPLNMGYPLNTTDDDLFYTPVKHGAYSGIYSNYDQESTYGLMDIYWVKVYNELLPRPFSLKGQVNTPNPALLANGNLTASLLDNKAGKIVSQVTIDSDGGYILNAGQGDYQLLIDGEGIKPVSVPVELEVNQKDASVELALITALAVGIGETDILISPSELPVLEVKDEQYLFIDSVPVSIKLEVDMGSDLKVETFVDNKIANSEEFHLSKSSFAYLMNPEPGENKLVFTLTDDRGDINQQEVYVYYTPKQEEQVENIENAEQEIKTEPTALSEVALLAPIGLRAYLQTMGDVNYNSKAELYSILIANADENDYTSEEVNELFSVMLTQRDKEEFISAIEETSEFDNSRLEDSILNALNVPLAIVKNTYTTYTGNTPDIHLGLISLVPFEGESSDELDYILSFSGVSVSDKPKIANTDNEGMLQLVSQYSSPEETQNALNLASTTQPLETYYQNLLAGTEGELKYLLAALNFKENNILNSVDLANHLLVEAPKHEITIETLVTALEIAQDQSDKNLSEFKEALALNAAGELKMSIDNIALEEEGISSYEALINSIIQDSKTSAYTPQEVYELLLKMLGILRVEELTNVLQEEADGQLDSLAGAIEKQQFSKPVELIQYLITHAPYYDYSESEINNMLLRMLLEKGIDNYIQDEEALQSKKLIKRNRLITTIILANILIIILFVIFWRRKKKKQTN